MGANRLSALMKLPELGKAYGVEVKHLEDMPKLAEAMEAFGKFESARRMTEWYYMLAECVEMEHKIETTDTTA